MTGGTRKMVQWLLEMGLRVDGKMTYPATLPLLLVQVSLNRNVTAAPIVSQGTAANLSSKRNT